VARAHALRRLTPHAPRFVEVDTFDALTDVELIDAPVPVEDGIGGRTSTVQDAPDPRLQSSSMPPTHRPRVAIVPDGRLATSGGAVLTRDGQLVVESLWDEEHRLRQFDPPPQLPPARRLAGRHASVVSLWSHNFFHWLFEALPRLAVLEASGVVYDSLIVPEPLSPFQLETLELLGIPPDRITPFTGEHVQADELVWVAPLAPIGHPTQHSVAWLKRSLRELDIPTITRGRRIYITRTGSRKVVNERALLERLAPLGFEAIDPGELRFREQVGLFASTEVAVGPHGAAFANGIFSDSLSVLELYQPAHVNVSVSAVMAAAGHDHWSLICKRVPSLSRPRHHNMWASWDAVRGTLERMGIDA
jgi:capsular polysaccharide biosynthesis protein